MLTDIQSFFCNLSPLAIALASPFFILGISGTGTPSLSYIIIGGALFIAFNNRNDNRKEK